MAFKLGKEKRSFKNPKDNQIFRKKLGDGIMGEANSDGSIYIDKSVPEEMVGYVERMKLNTEQTWILVKQLMMKKLYTTWVKYGQEATGI